MSSLIVNMLNEQRRRLIGGILRPLEQDVYPLLDREMQNKVRSSVLSAVASYHNVVLDLVKASVEDGNEINGHALEVLRDLNLQVSGLRRELGRV